MSDVALRFGAKDDGLQSQFRRVNKDLESLQATAKRVAGSIGGGFQSLVPILGALSFAGLVRESLQLADTLDRVSKTTGIAVEELQALQFIAEQSGSSFESVSGAVTRLQKALTLAGEGGKEATEALSRLGIPVSEFLNLSPDEQFLKVAESISAIQSPAEQATTAIALFGRSGAELLPVLTQSAEELGALSARFDTLGITLGGDTVSKLDDLGDSLDLVAGNFKKVASEILALAAPAITSALDGVSLGVKALLFSFKGEGENEIANVTTQIDRLAAERDRILQSSQGLPPRGSGFAVRLREIRFELDQLKERESVLLGLNAALTPKLQTISVDAPTTAPSFSIPQIGPAQPTPADRRAAADAAKQETLDIKALELQELEAQNQEHLDRLLQQDTAYAASKFEVESSFQGLLAESRRQFGIEEINWEQIKASTIFDIAGGLFSSLASQNEKFAKIQQGIALAQAVWYTGAGIANALRSVPFPANIAAAAKVAAVGAIQIAKIKSTSFGGGGGAASGGGALGGAGSTALPANQNAPGQNEAFSQSVTEVRVIGAITDSAGRILADLISEDVKNRDVVLFDLNTRQARELGLSPA